MARLNKEKLNNLVYREAELKRLHALGVGTIQENVDLFEWCREQMTAQAAGAAVARPPPHVLAAHPPMPMFDGDDEAGADGAGVRVSVCGVLRAACGVCAACCVLTAAGCYGRWIKLSLIERVQAVGDLMASRA